MAATITTARDRANRNGPDSSSRGAFSPDAAPWGSGVRGAGSARRYQVPLVW